MAGEYDVASFNGYNLILQMKSKNEMQQDASFTRSKLWKDIKTIRRADPAGGIIPLQNRICVYGTRTQLVDELFSYHTQIKLSIQQNMNNQENQNLLNINNNNADDDDAQMQGNNADDDDAQMQGNNDDEEEEEERIPLPLTLQISSPNDYISGEQIGSWFKFTGDTILPNGLVNQLAVFIQEFLDKFTGPKYDVNLECRSYNELVKKHEAAKYDPNGALTIPEWIGNQHKVMKKKGKSISGCVGSYHIVVSLNLQPMLRNDAPNECNFRIAYCGPPEQFKRFDAMISAKTLLESHVGTFFASSINIMKASKRTRLETISAQMTELEQEKHRYEDNNEMKIEYYEKMDKLRKERGLLLESVEIEDDDDNNNNNNNDEQHDDEEPYNDGMEQDQ